MKRIISVILLIMLLAGQCPVFAETAIDTGIWEKRAYVDEFDLPTDEYYISNKEPLVGKFSNSATTDSLVNAWLYVDNNIVSIKLIEYGNHVVKNAYSQTEYYDVVVMDPVGEKYYFDGYMESGEEVITFDQQNSDIIIKALCGNGTVRFAITEADNATTKYILTIDDTTGFYNFLPYSEIGSFCEGFARVKKGEKYGFIDSEGNLVISCEYDHAYLFSEGLACVKIDEKYSFVDTEGNLVIHFKEDAYPFSEGLACVKEAGKWGFIDASGNLVIPCEYDYAYPFFEGLAKVKKDGKLGLVDPSGNLVADCEYDEIDYLYEWPVRVKKDGKWGFVNADGSLIIPCEYDSVSYFNEGYAFVKKDGKWGAIDNLGNLVISYTYEKIYETVFSEGLISVLNNGKWGVIDTTGNIILPCSRDLAYGCFKNGLSCVYNNGKYGFVDVSGEVVIPYQFDDVYLSKFDNGVAQVKMNDKWGFIDTAGAIIIPCVYENAKYGEGYFSLLKDGEITIIPREDIQPNWEAELAKQEEIRRIEAEKKKLLVEYSDKETIKQAQTALNAAGYDCGKPDGIAGKGTAGAVTNYQTDKALNITGTITHELLISLGVIAE